MEKAKVMGDFGDDQFNDMICVEPGLVTAVDADRNATVASSGVMGESDPESSESLFERCRI